MVETRDKADHVLLHNPSAHRHRHRHRHITHGHLAKQGLEFRGSGMGFRVYTDARTEAQTCGAGRDTDVDTKTQTHRHTQTHTSSTDKAVDPHTDTHGYTR